MSHLLTGIAKYEYGRVFGLHGKEENIVLMMQSLALKLTKISPVILIDTNGSFTPQYYTKEAMKRIHIATPFTIEEFQSAIRRLRAAIEHSKAKVVLISSLDDLFMDRSIAPEDVDFMLGGILDELLFLTEAHNLITLVGMTHLTSDRAERIKNLIEPKLDFYGLI